MRPWIVASLAGHTALIVIGTLLSSLFAVSGPPLEVISVNLAQLELPGPASAVASSPPPPAVRPEAPKLAPEEPKLPQPEIAKEPVKPVPPRPDLPVAEKAVDTAPQPEPAQPETAKQVPEGATGTGTGASDGSAETSDQSISDGTSMRMRAPVGVADYYFALLSRKISRRWETNIASGRGRREVQTVIRFRVGAAGEILDADVATSSGLSVFDRQCLAAVQAANPLPPPPAQYLRGGSLPIELTFTLNP